MLKRLKMDPDYSAMPFHKEPENQKVKGKL